MDLPENFVRQVRQGRAVLFLGAGATRGARTPEGREPPLGNELRDRIAKQFLKGDHYSSESLAWVTELASSATNLFEVQDFIADQFRDLRPADFHLLIPTFRWRGIATTNYDRVVEAAYNSSGEAVQTVVPFLSNKDRVDEKLRDPSSVALLKLHGCITHTHDSQLPLILTIEQYATYREGRTRIFQMLEEWGSENTIIFVGHTLQDPNLRSVLLDVSQKIPSRPRYYLVRPGVKGVERDFWNSKQISVLDATFEDLLRALDTAIVKSLRPLAARLDADHPVQLRFVVRDKPSPALLEFLANDVEYVHEGISSLGGDPSRFYSGFGLEWYPIMISMYAEGLRISSLKMSSYVLKKTAPPKPSFTSSRRKLVQASRSLFGESHGKLLQRQGSFVFGAGGQPYLALRRCGNSVRPQASGFSFSSIMRLITYQQSVTCLSLFD